MAEAIRLMNKNFQKISLERKLREEVAGTAEATIGAQSNQEGCDSGTCGECYRCEGEAHCEAWAAEQESTANTEAEESTDTAEQSQNHHLEPYIRQA